MNSRAAKLLAKLSHYTNTPIKELKAHWKNPPPDKNNPNLKPDQLRALMLKGAEEVIARFES